jgi:ribonucleoside-diphosphate reductase alpha chain
MPTSERPPVREKLPSERPGFTRRFSVNYLVPDPANAGKMISQELTFYVQPHMYDDGRLAEVFIKGAKQGELLSGALDMMATMISIGLQYGIPLQLITSKLRNHRFGPGGFTGDPEFHSCTSVFDLIAQYLDKKFPDGRLISAEPVAEVMKLQAV